MLDGGHNPIISSPSHLLALYAAVSIRCPGGLTSFCTGWPGRIEKMKVEGLGWLGIRTERSEETVGLFRDVMRLEVTYNLTATK